jgi:hypothetical protein
MSSKPPPPSRSDVERRFAAVLDQSESREQVERSAAQWAATDPEMMDEHVWWGLEILMGIDERHGPNAPYLFDDEQMVGWFAEFESRCADRA